LLEIDVQGATQIRNANSNALVILLTAPSPEEQLKRLKHRGDDAEHVALRMDAAAWEVEHARTFANAEVINDSLDKAAGEIAAIIETWRRPPGSVSRE